jgi:(p)ppGpp synthase/HD superfamily hydrolase
MSAKEAMLKGSELCSSEMVRDAFAFAAAAHAGQRRKDGQPFIAHPVAVARLLVDRGYGEQTVAAGLLHDVVEDTPVTLDELRDRFGPLVAELVDAVTEDPALPYEERKARYRERVASAGPEARAICAADKIANARDLSGMLASQQSTTAFATGPEGMVVRLRDDLRMLSTRACDPGLVATLAGQLTTLSAIAG